jgi:hypothetical protein
MSSKCRLKQDGIPYFRDIITGKSPDGAARVMERENLQCQVVSKSVDICAMALNGWLLILIVKQ